VKELPSDQGALAEAVAVQLADEDTKAEVIEVGGENVPHKGIRVTWLGFGDGARVRVWVRVRVRVRLRIGLRLRLRLRFRLTLRPRPRLRGRVMVRGLRVTDDDSVTFLRPGDGVIRRRVGRGLEELGEEG